MTATHLFRGNDKGEILDASGKVVGRIVPVELPTQTSDAIREASDSYPYKPFPDGEKLGYMQVSIIHRTMLSAAPTDWSGVAVQVPERRTPMRFDRGCDDQGWNAVLDAIGVKG
jgi:hypothetical protein